MNKKIIEKIRLRHEAEALVSKAKKGASSRTKGHSFERLIAGKWREVDETAKRNLNEYREGTVDITTELPFAIQCKRWRTWPSPYKVMLQAIDGQRDGEIPVGIIRVDYEPEIMVVIQRDHAKILWGDDESKWFVKEHRRSFVFNAEYREHRYDCEDWQIPIIKYQVHKQERHIATLYIVRFEDFFAQVKKVYGKKEDSCP